ncbi:DUF4468 domain-containing protein [Acinetobacter variabilis]|uniref:DUF4468 domain-containing protein n=1 Tax=Acinetobacter variabilis TaxID=70346 RepID=UPI0021CD9336|nr:DUF4468 domain-containing protein [Acinetobacter variabilis]MCU4365644.1 DUF4468 domain-containing protein [Acinetobacter variabilis]
MKKILFVGVIGFGLVGCATSPDMQHASSPLSEVAQVVEIEGYSKDQLFESSKIWMAKVFNSSNNVVQYADKNTGSIIGKGNIQYPCSGFMDCEAFGRDVVNFTIKIDTKDSRARVAFSDISRKPLTYVKGGLNTNIGRDVPIMQIKQQQQVKAKMESIIQQYKQDIINQKSDSNW